MEAGKAFLTQNLINTEVIKVTLTGDLNIIDSRNIIKVSDPFFKEILEIWSEANYDENNMSDYHLWSSPLWYNSLVRVENRPVFYKDWFLKGITKVEHLMDDSGKFLSLTTFQTIHDLTVRPLTFLGIISSIKPLQRYNAVKCNLELTTKSAWVPRSAVFSTRMLGGWPHRSCDSLVRSVFPSCWVLSAIFFVFPRCFSSL